ncbi:MAG: phosphoenolpyruvate carboxylase, partial [Solirubrobacterales bacterium]
MADPSPSRSASADGQRISLAARSFEADVKLLTEVLADVVRNSEGAGAIELHERAVGLARFAREGDAVASDQLRALIAELTPRQTELLVRSLTRWFQLINLAEDND